MKKKFNRKIKKYVLKRGDFLYVPSNLKQCLPVYEIEIKRSLGCAYLSINGNIEKIECGTTVLLKAGMKDHRIIFNMTYDIFTDITEDEVRFDID